jgi:hypothetical protein
VQDVGIGKLGGQGRPRDVARQRRQSAVAQGRGEGFLGEIAVEHLDHLGIIGPHSSQ